jgi:hypothetical protein
MKVFPPLVYALITSYCNAQNNAPERVADFSDQAESSGVVPLQSLQIEIGTKLPTARIMRQLITQ